jgi:hypothetical protein
MKDRNIISDAQDSMIDFLLEGCTPNDFSSRCSLLLSEFKFTDQEAAAKHINRRIKERHGSNVITFARKPS